MTHPFNVALVEARTNAGLTKRQVADRAGFTLGFVQQYEECAINPTMRTVFNFAQALGWTVTISRDGVTIEGADGAVLLRDWNPDERAAFLEAQAAEWGG